MTGSPEEDWVEKMLLNAPSGGYINYSPSIQVYFNSKILFAGKIDRVRVNGGVTVSE